MTEVKETQKGSGRVFETPHYYFLLTAKISEFYRKILAKGKSVDDRVYEHVQRAMSRNTKVTKGLVSNEDFENSYRTIAKAVIANLSVNTEKVAEEPAAETVEETPAEEPTQVEESEEQSE